MTDKLANNRHSSGYLILMTPSENGYKLKEAMSLHGSIQELNSVNEAARFDDVLSGYFRVSTTAGKRRKACGGRRFPSQPAENNDSETSPETCLKQLKRLLRDAEAPVQSQYIQRLHAMILYQLKRSKTYPTIFSRAVELCREVFKRSVAYRALIATQAASFFDQLLRAAGEDPSANVSKALRARNRGSMHLTMVLSLIETWKQDFGEKYPSLVAGHAVLMERGYEFPHERERLQEEREREVDTRRHRERVNNAKKQQRDQEMTRYMPEMEQVLVEMNRVFEILVPTLDAFHVDEGEAAAFSGENAGLTSEENVSGGQKYDAPDAVIDEEDGYDDDMQWNDVAPPSAAVVAEDNDEEDAEWESVTVEGDSAHGNALSDDANEEDDAAVDQMDINDIVQAYGLGSSSYQLTIEVSKQVCEESSKNDALFRSLADGALRIQKRFLPLLEDWEQHSTLTEPSSFNSSSLQSQHEVLQRIRDLRDRMTRALLKWDDLVQGSTKQKRDPPIPSAVISLPLDAYYPPTKRQRQSS